MVRSIRWKSGHFGRVTDCDKFGWNIENEVPGEELMPQLILYALVGLAGWYGYKAIKKEMAKVS